MSCIQQNFPSKFEPNDAFYEKLEENTFVAVILKHPVVSPIFVLVYIRMYPVALDCIP